MQVVPVAEERHEDGGLGHRGRGRVDAARLLQESLRREHVEDEVEADVVEHDRDDHLVGAGERLEHAGDAGPQRAGEHADDDGDERVDAVRQRRPEADPAAERGTEEHLALAPDVEQARAEGEADAEARGDERGREGERLGERPDPVGEVRSPEVVDRALEEGGVRAGDAVPDRLERVCGPCEEVGGGGPDPLVGRGDEDRADEHREDDRDDADERVAEDDLPERLAPAGAGCARRNRPLGTGRTWAG